MCKQLEVSRAAYYKWLHREILEQELGNMELAELIKEYDERFNYTHYSKKRVHRIMQKLDIANYNIRM